MLKWALIYIFGSHGASIMAKPRLRNNFSRFQIMLGAAGNMVLKQKIRPLSSPRNSA